MTVPPSIEMVSAVTNEIACSGEVGQHQFALDQLPGLDDFDAFSSLLPKNSRVPLIKTALGAIT